LTWLEETVKEFGRIFQCVQQDISAYFDIDMLQASFDEFVSERDLSVIEHWIADLFHFNAYQMADGDVLQKDHIG